jgi:hypothetical protein
MYQGIPNKEVLRKESERGGFLRNSYMYMHVVYVCITLLGFFSHV